METTMYYFNSLAAESARSLLQLLGCLGKDPLLTENYSFTSLVPIPGTDVRRAQTSQKRATQGRNASVAFGRKVQKSQQARSSHLVL